MCKNFLLFEYQMDRHYMSIALNLIDVIFQQREWHEEFSAKKKMGNRVRFESFIMFNSIILITF